MRELTLPGASGNIPCSGQGPINDIYPSVWAGPFLSPDLIDPTLSLALNS